MFKKIITWSPTVAKKLLFWFLLMALLPLGIAGYLNYENSITILKKEVTKNLIAIADHFRPVNFIAIRLEASYNSLLDATKHQ